MLRHNPRIQGWDELKKSMRSISGDKEEEISGQYRAMVKVTILDPGRWNEIF
jgi:hypothetical protein